MSDFTIGVRNETGAELTIADIGLVMDIGETIADIFAEVSEADYYASADLETLTTASDIVMIEGAADLSVADGLNILKSPHKKYVDDQDDAIITEVDAIETAVGLQSNGAFDPYSGTNYLDATTTVKEVGTALDTAVKAVDDAKVEKTGDTMSGDLLMGANAVKSSFVPNASDVLVNKGYVDLTVLGVAPKAGVRVAASVALPAATYSNGTAGVGATLTADANGAFPTVDGVSDLAPTEDILVAAQSTAIQNGPYVITQLGDAGTPWILTRRTDMDGSPENELMPGVHIPIKEGDSWAGFMFYLLGSANVPRVVGTDSLDFDNVPGDASVAGVQAELDNVETSMGLNNDGTFIAHSGTNYMDAAGTAPAARELLDTQLKTVSDEVADLLIDSGDVYGRDTTRNIWKGTALPFTFGLKNQKVRSRFLQVAGGVVSDIATAKMYRQMVLTSMAVSLGASGTAAFEVYKNAESSPIATLNVTADTGATVDTLDVDLVDGDTIKVFCDSTAGVESPHVTVVVAYAKDIV